ncbi:MAG: FIST signal transduction protein [Actinomycetota bacterium]
MAVGHSEDVEPRAALDEVIEQCKASLGDVEPRAALLVSTYELDPVPLVDGVRAAFPNAEVVGATSAAEMSSVLGYQEGSVMLSVFGSDSVDFTAGLGENLSGDPVAAARAAAREAKSKSSREPKLAIVSPAPVADPLAVLEGLRAELGPDLPILGGVSAGTFENPNLASQWCNDRVVHDGVAVLLFSGSLAYSFGIDNGWKPVGKPGRITKADQGVVREIDGRPAIEFYERYLGQGATPSPANPLAVFEEGADDFYLRAVATHDLDPESGSIVIFGGPPQDSTVQLTVAMTDDIFGGAKSSIQRALKSFPSGVHPDAAIVFSCMVRKALLGSRAGEEMDIARAELGDAVPICGFYVYGEIAPLESGSNQFHNETIVTVLLGTE